jgi:hypothetical protein
VLLIDPLLFELEMDLSAAPVVEAAFFVILLFVAVAEEAGCAVGAAAEVG